MKMNMQKNMMIGALSLALVTTAMTQSVFADAKVNATPTTGSNFTATVDTTPTGEMIVSTATTPAAKPLTATACTAAIVIDQPTFKAFIKDMNLKANVPAATLAQAEKHFKTYKAELKAKHDKKAMASFEKMMALLAKYQDLKAIKVIEATVTAQ